MVFKLTGKNDQLEMSIKNIKTLTVMDLKKKKSQIELVEVKKKKAKVKFKMKGLYSL